MSDVVKYEKLPMTTMGELAQAGQLIAQSGMFGINNPAAGFVVACTCQQQGITMMDFQRTYHIIDNKPSMRADAMLAEFRKRGGKCKIVENSVTRAAAEFEFEENKATFSFTMEDAKRTGDCFNKGTLKHNWEHRADDMLWARMVSRAVRRLCPEIVSGLYTPEEVADFEPAVRDGGEPVAISEDDAAARAKAVQAVTETFAPSEIVPEGFGAYTGKRWGDLETDLLDKALKSPKLTEDHKSVISAILSKRGDV